jgi:hypothetical protein
MNVAIVRSLSTDPARIHPLISAKIMNRLQRKWQKVALLNACHLRFARSAEDFHGMHVRPFALAIVLSLAFAPGVSAVQQAKSRYSTIELSKCRPAGSMAWQCNGLPGYPIYVATAKLHTFVSAGRAGHARRAAKQSLGVANTLFDGKSPRTAVEWRFTIRDKKVVPYATIVRYFTQSMEARGEVVVVTRVTDNESCQVARIDALANSNAMVLAREIADRQARTFDCRQEPSIAGATGKSPM